MTIFCGPQDGGGAGTMSQAQWEEVESKVWRDGVISGARNTFTVTTTTGLGISVNTGDAIVDGFRFYADATTPLTAAAADPSLPRIDLVVLRIDEAAHTSTIDIKTGTPAGSPVAPTATKTVGGTYELGIYQVRVNAGATSITSLTDVRTYTAPVAHATAHASGGSDPVSPSSIGAVGKNGDTMTGMLAVSRTLSGTTKQYVEMVAPDGKTYSLSQDAIGNFYIGNETDGVVVLVIGPTGAMTANGATVWTSSNDGGGSGLDADKIDGIDSLGLAQTGTHNSVSPLKISAGTVLPASLDANEIFFLLA